MPKSNARDDLQEFTQCLSDSGAKFYGAFWCSYCKDQKQLFGTSVKDLPYTECSTPDGNSQIQECIDKNVQTYPTWIFSDESVLTGVVQLETLAEKTNCTLPDNTK